MSCTVLLRGSDTGNCLEGEILLGTSSALPRRSVTDNNLVPAYMAQVLSRVYEYVLPSKSVKRPDHKVYPLSFWE